MLGAWNPAIFQPGWMAQYLLGFPAGERIPAATLLAVPTTGIVVGAAKQTTYISDIGISVNTDRLEIYVNDLQPETIAKAEQAAINVFAILPHTPFGATGVNYNFTQAPPDDALLDRLHCGDRIHEHYRVRAEEFKSTIEIAADVSLNFTRTPSIDSVTFNFNYHHQSPDYANTQAFFTGLLRRYLDQSQAILTQLYQLREYESEGHVFPAQAQAQPQGAA